MDARGIGLATGVGARMGGGATVRFATGGTGAAVLVGIASAGASVSTVSVVSSALGSGASGR